MTPRALRHTFRTAAVVASTTAIVLLPLSPVLATPEGWSNPDPVSPLKALTVYVFGPLGLYLLTMLLASVPRFLEGARNAPTITDPTPDSGLDALFGGEETPELEAADDPS